MDKNQVVEKSLLLPAIFIITMVVVNFGFFVSPAERTDLNMAQVALNVILLISILSTYKMLIRVEKNKVSIIYGISILRFSKSMEQLEEVSFMKTAFLWGIGIRWTPEGMLYNINSSDLVRISYKKNGKSKKFMVGVSQREKLKEILERVV